MFFLQSRQLSRRKLCDLSHGATIYIVSPWSRVGKYMVGTKLTLMVHLKQNQWLIHSRNTAVNMIGMSFHKYILYMTVIYENFGLVTL